VDEGLEAIAVEERSAFGLPEECEWSEP